MLIVQQSDGESGTEAPGSSIWPFCSACDLPYQMSGLFLFERSTLEFGESEPNTFWSIIFSGFPLLFMVQKNYFLLQHSTEVIFKIKGNGRTEETVHVSLSSGEKGRTARKSVQQLLILEVTKCCTQFGRREKAVHHLRACRKSRRP